MKDLLKIVFLILITSQPICVEAQSTMLTKAQWIEDLEYLVDMLKQNHPHLYYRCSEKEFQKAICIAENEIQNSKSDLEAFMALKRVVAKIQDGHTQIWDNEFLGIENLRFPFRLDKFTDGVFITVIRDDYQKYLGAKIISIDGMPIDEVLKRTAEITNMDTDFGRIRPSVQDITFAKTLGGLGIISDENQMRLKIEKNGRQKEFIIKSVLENSPIIWSNRVEMAPAKGNYVNASTNIKYKLPLHLQKQDENFLFYWFKHLKKENALYFQYNQVWATQPNAGESWNEFTQRIWKYIDKHNIQKLIIDIRYNDGGNGRTMIPFINEIIKRDRFCNGKNLYILVGNRTCSAAVIFMTELAVHTDAIFVGTPPSSPFNFFSDQILVGNLPNSGANLGIASRQIDNAWSSRTKYFSPNIPAPFSSENYFTGKDPALEVALKGDYLSVEEYTAKYGAEKGKIHLLELKGKYGQYKWWIPLQKENLESNINNAGYRYLNNGQMDEVYELFKLNTMLFPQSYNVWDSFAEWYLNKKDYEIALKYYKKSLELNPDNSNAQKMIEKIEINLKN